MVEAPRLCAIGCQNPDLTKVDRDATSLSAVTELLCLQPRASEKWRVGALDVRIALWAGDCVDTIVNISFIEWSSLDESNVWSAAVWQLVCRWVGQCRMGPSAVA